MNFPKELYQSPNKIKENIIQTFEQRNSQEENDGQLWYVAAHSFCDDIAKKYNKSLISIAGITAALSPQKEWGENKKIVEKYLKGQNRHIKQQIEKAHKIIHSTNFSYIMHILGGEKTKNFFGNIWLPQDSRYVTLDRHAIYMCTGKDLRDITVYQYRFLKQEFIKTAKYLNILPVNLQGITWLTHKRLKKTKFYTNDSGQYQIEDGPF